MQFRVQTQDLSAALAIVTRAIAAKPIRPVLEGVLMETTDNSLRLTATDGSMTICTEIPAFVDVPGSAVTGGRFLSDLTRRLPGSEVDVTVDGLTAKVKSGKSRTTLTVMDGADFPQTEEISAEGTAKVPCAILKDMLATVAFCVCADESRLILTGVHATVEAGQMEMVALDGFRLALSKAQVAGIDGTMTIPGPSAGELQRILPNDGDCTLSYTDGRLRVDFSGVTFQTTLLSGAFPEYRRLIPGDFKYNALVDRSEIQSATDRASLMAKTAHNNLVRMNIGPDGINISARDEMGEVQETVSAQTNGGELSIAFNAKYLMDIFKACGDGEVSMHFNGPNMPCIVTPDEGRDTLFMVLPVRVA